MRRGVLLGLIAVAVLAVVMVAAPSEAVKPVPVDYQSQIDALKAQVDALAAEVANIQLIPGPEGPPGPPGPPGDGAVMVYDATGAYLGILAAIRSTSITDDGAITIFVPTVGRFLELRWDYDLTSTTSFPLGIYYSGPNCTGDAYTDKATTNPPYLYGLILNTGPRFFAISGLRQQKQVLSHLKDSGSCKNIIDTMTVYPLTEVNPGLSWPVARPLSFQ